MSEEVTSKIVVEGLSKSFAGASLPVLDSVDLEIPENSFTCLLGPSGCGKSTLLNIIAGFVAASSGRVRIDGREITRAGADRGIVFQEYALFPWLTAQANVEFGPMIRRLPVAERRKISDHYLTLVGLSDKKSSFPAELSGGMKQRVAIARALANYPSILLMDEPFGALDAQNREVLQEELLRIWEREKKTVVFVTHSIPEALFLADRVVIMGTRPGTIRQVIDIDAERPRDLTSPRLIELEKSIHRQVREEASKLGVW
jgi:NitT/TauT family transport system ATP-binding protein